MAILCNLHRYLFSVLESFISPLHIIKILEKPDSDLTKEIQINVYRLIVRVKQLVFIQLVLYTLEN